MDCCSWKQKALLVFPLLDSCGGKKKNPVGGSSNLWMLSCYSFPSSQALKIGLSQKQEASEIC